MKVRDSIAPDLAAGELHPLVAAALRALLAIVVEPRREDRAALCAAAQRRLGAAIRAEREREGAAALLAAAADRMAGNVR